MVLLGQDTTLVRHRGPSRGKSLAFLAAVTAAFVAVCGVVVARFEDRPPWGSDIAYEAGYRKAARIRAYDRAGDLVRVLLHGGCARMEAEGAGRREATYDPALWVEGCLDGAAGRPSRHEGVIN
ncbi:hypothetical protein ACFPM3_10355 [Streptomyces coeruleoprunus]|uniref:Uncharacterized protein n=1 Tax=Streptomyces coeruleoprunus TaxID=285563 RepID=A0ABV9XD00_9ACTN